MRTRSPLARVGCATALAAVTVAVAATAALGAGSTGDGAAIRLFRDVAAHTNAQPAMQVVQSGYMAETAHVRSPASFSYRWGFGSVPKGFVRSTETIVYAQHAGRVVWVTDVLDATAPGCHEVAGCPQLAPIELFVTKVAAFAGVVDGPGGTVGCFEREPFTNVPYRAGGRWWTAVGDFRPLIVRGNQALVTITYAWSDGQHVIERDSIDETTRLFSASSFHVGHGTTRATPAFSFSQEDAALSYAPPAPKVTICR
ncbi:MAG TPA: hypothetical protein VGZ03_10265 [Acidimicrobiales bacterium]|nr:hypothetical protein [Acidimicrobiales bacterium]